MLWSCSALLPGNRPPGPARASPKAPGPDGNAPGRRSGREVPRGGRKPREKPRGETRHASSRPVPEVAGSLKPEASRPEARRVSAQEESELSRRPPGCGQNTDPAPQREGRELQEGTLANPLKDSVRPDHIPTPKLTLILHLEFKFANVCLPAL